MRNGEYDHILQWSVNYGYVRLSFPATLSPEEVDEIEQVIAIAIRMMRRTAEADSEDHGQTESAQ